MFKNNVFKVSVDTKEWFKAAAIRAIKTFAQSMASMITVGLALSEISWGYVGSVAAVAAIYSLLTSVGGIPEAKAKEV